MSKQVTLTSERLYFRPVGMKYCNDEYVSWLNDEVVTRYMEIFEPYSKIQLENYLNTVELNDQLLFWAIHLIENDKHIGNIKIDPINRRHGVGEYGIMIGYKSAWGKGYAKEASERIIKYCFEVENLRKLSLGVIKENKSAIQLYKKMGFEIEGVNKKDVNYNGVFYDVVRMAIFNPEYAYQ